MNMDFSSLTLQLLQPKLLAGDEHRRRRPCRSEELLRLVKAMELAISEFRAGTSSWTETSWMRLMVEFDQTAGKMKPADLDHTEEFRRAAAWKLHHRREAAYERADAILRAIGLMDNATSNDPGTEQSLLIAWGDSPEITRKHYLEMCTKWLPMDYPFDWHPW